MTSTGQETARRRTFAIISHPDAGKTTLTEKLLLFGGAIQLAGTVKGRKALSSKTGISEQQLLEWANVSDYMRIPGMGRAKVGLVRAAGVTTVRELAYRNPARLAQSMREANEKRKLVRILPSEKSVCEIIAKAKKLPPKITY